MTPGTAAGLWAVARAGAALTRRAGRVPSVAETTAHVGRANVYAELDWRAARIAELDMAGRWPVLRAAYGEERSGTPAATVEPQARRDDARRSIDDDPCPSIYTPPGGDWTYGCDALRGHVGPHGCAHVTRDHPTPATWVDTDPGAER